MIKRRKTANDVFITPPKLAKSLVEKYHTPNKDDIWYDPFKNSGNFYNNYPTEIRYKVWSEILEGKDFFEWKHPVSIISTNPPWSILDKVLEHSCSICEKEIGYLIGLHALTPRRIENMNKHGFYLKSLEMFKVWKWYGMSCYVVFSKEITKNIIEYNRVVWR